MSFWAAPDESFSGFRQEFQMRNLCGWCFTIEIRTAVFIHFLGPLHGPFFPIGWLGLLEGCHADD
jgi:hypothetical protein